MQTINFQKLPFTFKNFLTLFLIAILISLSACKTVQVVDCPDRDNDGIPDIVDKCPDIPGLEEEFGCPLYDADGDGIDDSEDECPDEPGTRENNGCPFIDRDGDGVIDKLDQCPDIIGMVDLDGCPEILNSRGSKIKELKLPAPTPTEFEVFDASFFEGIQTMEDLDKTLKASLRKNGYKGNKYLYVKNGFALITDIEQIDENGNIVSQEGRWDDKIWQDEGFSITSFIKNLFMAQPGYYRCFVFIVTSDSYSYTTQDFTEKVIEEKYEEGTVVLPEVLKSKPFTKRHTVSLNVYEFIKLEHENTIKYNIKSEVSGSHIDKSKLVDFLKN